MPRYGYAAVVELLLKRGADAQYKDADGKTPLDVAGMDLGEDTRHIINNLFLQHREKIKNSKQRRGSCPAIPRAALMSAVNASSSNEKVTTPTGRADGSQPLLPLPSVLVSNVATQPTEKTGEMPGVDGDRHPTRCTGHTPGDLSAMQRRPSYSLAAHIRVSKIVRSE